MGKTIYIESNAGISGDMFVAALLDLGADENTLKKALSTLPLDGYEVVVSRKLKSGIDVCDFDVVLDEAHANHDHDMEYLHGHEHAAGHHHDGEGHSHDHGHVHNHGEDHDHIHTRGEDHDHVHTHGKDHDHTHSHGDGHDHEHHHDHGHHHVHRGLKEVTEIINAADLTEGARTLALKIFDILAEAEAKAHNATKETVHFHEVGAVDSIVDIVAAAVCFDDLGITEVILPFLSEGEGTVRAAHGILPVPVPAVSNILAAHPIAVRPLNLRGEFVTPTGAAIAAAVTTTDRLPEVYGIERIGIGGGKREYERPSMLRIMEIHPKKENKAAKKPGENTTGAPGDTAMPGTLPLSDYTHFDESDTVIKLECDVDDATGEDLGYVMECLYNAGAREVHFLSIYMKKNRPATEIVVLCEKQFVSVMEEILFRETTTIGIRRCEMERSILPRSFETVATSYGNIRVKKVTLPDGSFRVYPEYESVRDAARAHHESLGKIRRAVIRSMEDL